MTGFGQARGENRHHAVTVTLRGVNHRFLEIKLHLGDEYRESEAELRHLLQRQLTRGRVEAGVEVRRLTEREADVEVHRSVVLAAHRALHELVEEGLLTRDLTSGDLLRLPEAVSVRLAPDRWEEADRELLRRVAAEALEQMVEARRNEGERLQAVIEDRLARLESLVAELAELRGEALEEAAVGLEARLTQLLVERKPELEVELDRSRLAQEVAILADKSDVQEELDRLVSHIAHFREVVQHSTSPPRSMGKRLDFLMQEIFRELNTLGAKCRHAGMIRTVLEAKGVSEQLREQVQNVE